MHIAIDARELAGKRTGTGRYLEQLLRHWARLDAARQHRFTLYAHESIGSAADGLNAAVAVLPGQGGTVWEQLTLASAVRRDRPDVLFAPAYTAPLATGVPVALTVHDVSFAAHPEWFRPRERWRRRLLTRAAARRARLVLTVSDFSRREIGARLGVPGSRIRVIRHGLGLLDDDAEAARVAAPRDPEAARETPTVLFAGSILNRRHIPALVEAVALARHRVPGLRLVLVGDNRTWPHQDPAALAGRLNLSAQVDVRAFVPEEELRRLYAAATVFAFLSEYEGFGLTPLEALAAGVPPLVLDTPVAREVYGAAARYVAAPHPPLVAEALVTLVNDETARAALLAEAPSVLRRYRWSEAAAATLAAIEDAGR